MASSPDQGHGGRPAGGPLLPPLLHSRPPDLSQAWMVTFTDLVALLLAFFVMLFAMSKVEWRHWQNLVDALADNLNVVREIAAPLPDKLFDMDQIEVIPGVDLDYLSSVLRQQMGSEEILGPAIVQNLGDRLVISLPGTLLFAPAGTELPGSELSAAGRDAVFAVGGILRHLSNRVEVVGHVDPRAANGDFPSHWELSLGRAVQVAHMLARSGYRGEVLARGAGSSRFDVLSAELTAERRNALARRVDIVVLEYVGGEE